MTNSNSHIDINNSGGLIAGAAIGPTASVKAGDITSTVGSGNTTTESLTQAIAGARNYLSQKGDISADEKDATVRMLDNLEREVAHEKPNAGIIAGLWNTLQTVAAWAATAKPICRNRCSSNEGRLHSRRSSSDSLIEARCTCYCS